MSGKPPVGVLGRLTSALAPRRKVLTGFWQPEGGPYPRLIGFEPRELSRRPGLYLLWHLGVRPRWLRAGFSNDLGAAAALLASIPEVVAFAPHDGPFLSWSFHPAEGAAGRVSFLVDRLTPALQDMVLACDLPIDRGATAIGCPLPAGTSGFEATSAHR